VGQTDRAYQQLWRVVDGAVRDAFRKHGDYLTPKGRHSAKRSVVKRVTGTVLSFALNEAKRQRELAVTDARVLPGEHQAAGVTPAAEPGQLSPATHSYAHVNEACYQAIRRALFPVRRTRAIRRDAQAYKNAKAATTAMLESAFPELSRGKQIAMGVKR